MKIRELASLALVYILSKSGLTYEDYLRKWLFEDRMLSHNEGHGRILQVRTRSNLVAAFSSNISPYAPNIGGDLFFLAGRVRGVILALCT